MSATAACIVPSGDVVRCHIEGQDAAKQFLQSLRDYSLTGSELQRVLEITQFMPPEMAAPWNRGFFSVIQKCCQRAVDATP